MDIKKKNDKNLIRKLSKGNEKAFRRIYLTYHKELYSVALKYLYVEENASDAVHDIFLKLWENRKDLEKYDTISKFLFTALKNHVLNMVNERKRKLKKNIEIAEEKKREENIAENVVSLSEYRQVVQKAVKELPESRRRIYELRTENGLTNQEIANHLGLSIHTVKTQYYRGTKFIKNYVRDRSKNETGT